METQRKSSQAIAIVGMASHFPDAKDLFEFWRNVYAHKDSVTDNLDFEGYWRKDDYYRENSTDKDMTYAYKAGWIPPIDFDPMEFKLPPNMLESVCTAQLFALHVAKQALLDARIIGDNPIAVDRSKVGVILGGAGNGNTSFMLAARQQVPVIREIFTNMGLPGPVTEEAIQRLLDQYLEWNEDSFPGFLGNVACGRISSFYDFGGTSNMVDAACASSLAAIKSAISELHSGSCDAVVTGGVNLENSIFSFLCFSRTPALSPTNCCRPFDAKSDGMMLGDGVGLLVLKRLEDAQRDGDRIYAVIKSVEGSSDGRAKSIFAPRMEGQVLAIQRAYEAAGVNPGDIELVEAHGTGTLSGDQTELNSLLMAYGGQGLDNQSVAIGSIKSQIGHTRCAAGAASTIKTALGLHHKVLPATINVNQPNKLLAGGNTPLYVNTLNRPWIRSNTAGPRRAALSAFGFGGTNYHMVLEEYQHEQTEPYRHNSVADVVVLQADDSQALLSAVQGWQSQLSGDEAEEAYARLVALRQPTGKQECVRLGFAAEGPEQALSMLTTALDKLGNDTGKVWEHPLGIYFNPGVSDASAQGKVVALFPGQGSQYVNMALHVANEFPSMREVLADADRLRQDDGLERLSRLVYPAPAFSEQATSQQVVDLKSTDNAQPAIGAVSLGYYRILEEMGFKADFAAGHSFGELTALHVAGVLDNDSFHRLAMARGNLMKILPDSDQSEDRGAMLAASLSPEQAEQCLQQFDGLSIANINSNSQVVFGGGSQVVSEAQKHLQQQQVRCAVLPVSAAFHTRFVAHAAEPFAEVLASMSLHKPGIPVFSNVTAKRHTNSAAKIRAALTEQLTSTVRFRDMIENIYAAGGRYFVEMGPKGVLGKLVSDILGDRDYQIICLDPGEKSHDGQQLRKAFAKLAVLGVLPEHQDLYQLRPNLKAKKEKRLTYRMNGGYFFFDATKDRRKRAKRLDTTLVDAFVAQKIAPLLSSDNSIPVEQTEQSRSGQAYAANSPASCYAVEETEQTYIYEGREVIMATPKQDKADNLALGTVCEQIRAQQLTSEVHQQFQQNQKDYIQFLDSLLDKQFNLFDKHQGSSHFSDMIGSLNQSFTLLEQNQRSYHDNHQRYFVNQEQLLSYRGSGNGSSTMGSPQDALQTRSLAVQPSDSAVNGNVNDHSKGVNEYTTGNGVASEPTSSMPTSQGSVAETQRNGLSGQGQAARNNGVTNASGQGSEPAKPTVAAGGTSSELSESDHLALEQLRKVSTESLAVELVKIISDKTGYPEDMIGGDMDLEADLGIDSIKRIEIIGAMFKSFESDFNLMESAEDYAEMETFDVEQFSSINKLVSFLQEQIQQMIQNLEQGGSLTEALGASTGEVRNEASQVQRASYADMAMNGEDTQRCEVAESAELVNQDVADVMSSIGFVASSADMDGATHHPKSEPAISAPLVSAEPAGANIILPGVVQDKGPVTPENVMSTAPNRFEVGLRQLPLPDQQSVDLPDGFIWLVADAGHTAAAALLDKLAEKAQRTVHLQLTGKTTKTSHPSYQLTERDEDNLQIRLAQIRAQQGKIGGLIYLQEAGADAKGIRNCFAAKDYAMQQQLFMLTKHVQADLLDCAAQGRASLLVAGQLDGQLGFGGKRGYPLVSAGVTGLVKSLHHEWPDVRCRYVDLQPKMDQDQAAEILWQELHDADSQLLEVGRDAHGQRFTPGLTKAPLDMQKSPPLGKDDLVLVSGGARGITATCVLELARQSGASFLLLGRTDIEAAWPEWAEACNDMASLRTAAIEAVKKQGQQPTPVKIDRMLGPLLQVEEVRQTLQQLHELGCNASYMAVDILDPNKLKTALADVHQRMGKVTAVVHGAGNLADKKLDKKTAGDFESVFATKVRGLENLIKALPPTGIKQIYLFSSVSGFFGNAGQTDYAMANEVLSKFAHNWRFYYPQSRVCAINWGPWDSGMVSDTLKRAYQERGISIIATEDGAERFVRELSADCIQVLIGNDSYQHPKNTLLNDNCHVSTRRLNIVEQDVLSDHRIDGKAVLPATFAMTWLIQAATRVVPDLHLLALEDFQVLKGVVLEGQQEHEFETRVTPDTKMQPDSEVLFNVEVGSVEPQGWQPRYKGRVRFCTQVPKVPIRSVAGFEAQSHPDKLADRPLYAEQNKSGWLFHGPRLQGMQKLLSCDAQGIRALVSMTEPADLTTEIFAQSPVNPYLSDVFLQAPYLWLLLETDAAGLPMAVGQYQQFAQPTFGQPLLVDARCKDCSSGQVFWDLDVTDEQGQLLASFSDLMFTHSKSLRSKLLSEL